MVELYWLTTLGTIGTTCGVIATVLCFFTAAFTIVFLIADYTESEREQRLLTKHKKYLRIAWILTFFFIMIGIFVPSEAQLYKIYGIGGTLDFLKENPTAQQLPEKYIKVLDKFADDYLTEEKGEKK